MGAVGGWRKYFPPEVLPIAISVVAVAGLAAFRIVELIRLPDVQIVRRQYEWQDPGLGEKTSAATEDSTS